MPRDNVDTADDLWNQERFSWLRKILILELLPFSIILGKLFLTCVTGKLVSEASQRGARYCAAMTGASVCHYEKDRDSMPGTSKYTLSPSNAFTSPV